VTCASDSLWRGILEGGRNGILSVAERKPGANWSSPSAPSVSGLTAAPKHTRPFAPGTSVGMRSRPSVWMPSRSRGGAGGVRRGGVVSGRSVQRGAKGC
jgi:hypothetical protein